MSLDPKPSAATLRKRAGMPRRGAQEAISATIGGSLVLTLPEPPSANRWWRMVHGRMLTSKAAREYKALVGLLAVAHGVRAPLEGPIALSVTWYRGRKSGDLDKRLGVLLDGLQGVCYANDSQIVEIHAYRSDATPENPRVEVTITGSSAGIG